jgi:hypothetical protein
MSKDKEPEQIQWHPYFTNVLRLLVQEHYQVNTSVPVGDKPREADILLLRRKERRRPPFTGLWRHLTPSNVVEYKGQTVSARVADLALLVELGLGIHRRLNEERRQESRPAHPPSETSFWYVANELGRRFLRDAPDILGALEPVTAGMWRCQVLGHLVFLVSSVATPVERDTTPLHLLAKEPLETERELVGVIVNEPGLWEMYAPYLSSFHKHLWEEAKRMARSKKKTIEDYIDLKPLIETVGVEAMVKAAGVEKVVEAVGIDEVIQVIGLDKLVAHLTPKQLRELKEQVAKRG